MGAGRNIAAHQRRPQPLRRGPLVLQLVMAPLFSAVMLHNVPCYTVLSAFRAPLRPAVFGSHGLLMLFNIVVLYAPIRIGPEWFRNGPRRIPLHRGIRPPTALLLMNCRCLPAASKSIGGIWTDRDKCAAALATIVFPALPRRFHWLAWGRLSVRLTVTAPHHDL